MQEIGSYRTIVINEIHITIIVKDLVSLLLRLFKVFENGSFTTFILDFRWDRSIDPIRVIKNILFWFHFYFNHLYNLLYFLILLSGFS